jgi:response regulator RpfG family c-di-GMP phosphodiesterase
VLKLTLIGVETLRMSSNALGALAAATVTSGSAPAVGVSLDGASTLAELAQQPTVERAVEAVREFLGMDVAFTGEFADGHQIFRVLRGDGDSFGVSQGFQIPLEQTYCQRVMDGRLPNLITDVRGDDRAASLPVTEKADIGAFVSVPLRFSGGELYGTLCAGSHRARPDLGYRELQFLQVFARMISDALEREQLQQGATEARLQAACAATLIAAVQARDHYTGEHSKAVVEHAIAVARHLGLCDHDILDVEQVALLHDIGKIAIPDAILHKKGPLTDSEWKVMSTHPIKSAQLIDGVPGLSHLTRSIRAEHERWDGHGYPDGLAGENIPLPSRITLVCDAYHAMVSDRPYRKAMPVTQAREQIAAGAGSQFCPHVAHAFLHITDPNLSPESTTAAGR